MRRAVVTESAVANKVTSTPRLTRPSVNREANCSHGPYRRGGTRQEIGARIATRKFRARAPGEDIGSLGPRLAERHESASPLVPQLQPRRAQPLLQRELRHGLETVGSLVRGLQVVVRDPDAEVMHVVEADVAGEEPQDARQLQVRASRERSVVVT